MNIWFTSDTHYNHSNIVLGCSELTNKNGCRDFDNLEEHNQNLVDSINRYARPNDIIYHLGDWSLGGKNSIWDFYKQVATLNWHFIYGNHDHHIIRNRFLQNCELYPEDLFQSINGTLIKSIGGHDFVLNHYAMRTWDRSSQGTIHLYGHSHGRMPDYIDDDGKLFKTLDVGVDNAFKLFGEYRPFALEEVLSMMRTRVNLNIDYRNDKY